MTGKTGPTGKALDARLSQHPFESSPLLGTRQQTQSWGHLVRELEQEDRVDLDHGRDVESLSDTAEDVSAEPSLPLPKTRELKYFTDPFWCHSNGAFAGHPHMNRSISAVVKQRSRYYVPVCHRFR